jgi:hypothetical protein
MDKKFKITFKDILIIILFIIILYLVYRDYSINSKYINLQNKLQTNSNSIIPKL